MGAAGQQTASRMGGTIGRGTEGACARRSRLVRRVAQAGVASGRGNAAQPCLAWVLLRELLRHRRLGHWRRRFRSDAGCPPPKRAAVLVYPEFCNRMSGHIIVITVKNLRIALVAVTALALGVTVACERNASA